MVSLEDGDSREGFGWLTRSDDYAGSQNQIQGAMDVRHMLIDVVASTGTSGTDVLVWHRQHSCNLVGAKGKIVLNVFKSSIWLASRSPMGGRGPDYNWLQVAYIGPTTD